jgi:hypothetical protein
VSPQENLPPSSSCVSSACLGFSAAAAAAAAAATAVATAAENYLLLTRAPREYTLYVVTNLVTSRLMEMEAKAEKGDTRKTSLPPRLYL